MFADDARGERIQRADGGGVDLLERVTSTVGVVLGEFVPDPFAELSGRLLGEGERGDLVEVDPVLQDEVADAMNQRVRLTAAGAGFHEERVSGAGDDAFSRYGIGEFRGGHWAPYFSV